MNISKPSITRRAFLGRAAALSALSACSPRVQAGIPDVVLVIIDTLRADRLNATRNGIPVMPHLSALAASSICFTRAYTQETFTKPSVASILTSLYPEVHGVRFGIWTPAQLGKGDALKSEVHVDVLSPQLPRLPVMLKRQGYTTVGLQTNMQLHPESGFAHGFDHYAYLGDVTADVVSRQAISVLESVKQPLFLYVHYMDPHIPYRPPQDIMAMFAPPPEITAQDRELLANYRDYYSDLVQYAFGLSANRKMGALSRNGRNLVRLTYDCEARFADREIALLIAAARRRNPESLVVITSDHGEEFWEHGSVGHTKTAYRELAHVPLIFAAAGLNARQIETPVESIDIMPTIAAYLGAPASSDCQGRSLLPLFANDAPPESPAVYTSASGMQPWDRIHWRAASFQGHRLVKDISAPKTELFNISDDPYEQRCLAAQEPARVAELEKILDTFAEANKRHSLRQETVAKVKLDEESLEALRALGYIM